jgi:hypothetical protein
LRLDLMKAISAQLACPHPVDTLAERDLRMLAIANIATESAGAILPAHRIAETPGRSYPHRDWRGAARVALARLARLTAWQSCST